MKKLIRIKFAGGFRFEVGMRAILQPMTEYYDFVESDRPQVIIFGPYGGKSPPPGDYVRVGYFCECMRPRMDLCDWGFGIPYESEVGHPKYQRVIWHGVWPTQFRKHIPDLDLEISRKKKFCNFVFSHRVPFREAFFRKLSKYKRVDAPGISMNNMPSFDSLASGANKWENKRRFLSEYKFTIAFENYSYPAYRTEKIFDPMLVLSIPIYWGDPTVGAHFNSKSFINVHDLVQPNPIPGLSLLRSAFRVDLDDYVRMAPFACRVKRRIKRTVRGQIPRIEYPGLDDVVEKVIELDRDPMRYAQMLQEPWFPNNEPPSNERAIRRWHEIFEGPPRG